MDFLPAIQLIEKSKHVGFVLPQAPNHDVLASAEILSQFLSSHDRYVGIITPLDNIPAPRVAILPSLASLQPLTREFIISLNTSHTPISQLRYENTDNRVNIILSPSSNPIDQSHVSFREGQTQCDCIIAIGVDDIESIDTTKLDIDPSLFTRTPIITLDTSISHKKYGEINLLDSSLLSIAELTYCLLSAFPDHTFTAENATLLLSGILYRTNRFTTLTNATTLLSSHELIRLGGNYETAYRLARAPTPPALMPLIGRALARSRIDEAKAIVWSMVTRDDFLATNCALSDARNVLIRMEKEFPDQDVCVLLYQDPMNQRIYAQISASAPVLNVLRDNIDGEIENTYLVLSESYGSFLDAEHAIDALLGDFI